MTKPRFKIFKVQNTWLVVRDGRRDEDLGVSLRAALTPYSKTTQPRCAKFIEGFLNHNLGPNDDPDVALFADIDECRRRINLFLVSRGYAVVPSGRADGSYYTQPDVRLCISEASVGLNALGGMYKHLRLVGIRSHYDPTRVDGYETWSPEQMVAMTNLMFGSRQQNRAKEYFGSFFACKYKVAPAVRMDDAAGLGAKVLTAGTEYGWPASIFNLVTIMAEDGPRFADAHALTAEDWANGSNPPAFDQFLWAPNKKSNGVRVKTLVMSSGTLLNFRRSFDEDPNRPDMKVLEDLLAADDFEALRKIYLFPSVRGTPFAYVTFNNNYFRPAMEAGKVQLRTAKGLERPTGHRLRSGRIQEDADAIFENCGTEKEVQLNISRLKRDVHILSNAIWRYIGPARNKHVAKEKLRRLEAKWANRKVAMDRPGHPAELDRLARRVSAHG